MAVDPVNEWLTVAEAAVLLRVGKSAVKRLIERGRLPVFQLGPRKLRLRREDVEAVLTTVVPPPGPEGFDGDGVPLQPLTPEEKIKQLELIEELRRFQEEVAARHGVKQFSSSVPIINRARRLRSKQLLG